MAPTNCVPKTLARYAGIRLVMIALRQRSARAPPSVTVDPAEGLYMFGRAIARLTLFLVRFRVGVGFTRKRPDACRRDSGAGAQGAKKLSAAQFGSRHRRLLFLHHGCSFCRTLSASFANAKEAVSISMN